MSRSFHIKRTLLFAAAVAALLTGVAHAQMTGFTYQGRFVDSNLPQPTNGSYEMQFSLYNTSQPGTGVQIGTTQTISSVPVSNGIFTVQLDYGEAAFRPTTVFIEMGVRPVGGAAAFTILGPRQQVTAAPFAIHSTNADKAISASDADFFGGAPPSNYVQSTDPRLADDRNPLAGSAAYIQNQVATPQSANLNISGNGVFGGLIAGNGANVTNIDIANISTGVLQSNRGGTGVNNPGAAGNFLRSNGASWAATPLSSSDVPSGSVNYIQNTTLAQAASNFNISGNGNVGGTLTGGTVNAGTHFSIGNARVLAVDANSNTVVGTGANLPATGAINAFFGYHAGSATTTGAANSFFGAFAGEINLSGGNNAFFGAGTGSKNVVGKNNAFFGMNAGANTNADNNAFFGFTAGQANVSGIENSIFGIFAGVTNTASGNSFFGYRTGQATADGTNNSFFGRSAGYANIGGDDNSFFGKEAGKSVVSGSQNTFVGSLAGNSSVTGSSNTMVGYGAGGTVTNLIAATSIGVDSEANGNLVTVVGYQAKSAVGITNSTAIGANAFVSTSNTVVVGTLAMTTEFPGMVKVLNLGSAGSTSLCLNAQNQISSCTAGNRPDPADASGTVVMTALQQQNLQLREQLNQQKIQIDALKAVVCRIDPIAAICDKK